MKWLWRYAGEERALWKEVIVAKYGEIKPWCTENVSEPYGVGVWRTIRYLEIFGQNGSKFISQSGEWKQNKILEGWMG